MTRRDDSDRFVPAPEVDAAYARAATETPPPRLDAAIRAAARRAVHAAPGAAPVSARRGADRRTWWPLATAATLAVIIVGIVQVAPEDPARGELDERLRGEHRAADARTSAASLPPAESAPAAPAPAASSPAASSPAASARGASPSAAAAASAAGASPPKTPAALPSPPAAGSPVAPAPEATALPGEAVPKVADRAEPAGQPTLRREPAMRAPVQPFRQEATGALAPEAVKPAPPPVPGPGPADDAVRGPNPSAARAAHAGPRAFPGDEAARPRASASDHGALRGDAQNPRPARASGTAAAPAPTTAPSTASRDANAPPTPPAADKVAAAPRFEDWIVAIGDLVRAGRLDAARVELARLRDQYPGRLRELPPELAALMPPR